MSDIKGRRQEKHKEQLVNVTFLDQNNLHSLLCAAETENLSSHSFTTICDRNSNLDMSYTSLNYLFERGERCTKEHIGMQVNLVPTICARMT